MPVAEYKFTNTCLDTSLPLHGAHQGTLSLESPGPILGVDCPIPYIEISAIDSVNVYVVTLENL